MLKQRESDYLAFEEARGMVLENVRVLGPEEVEIGNCVGRVAAREVAARVESPCVDMSLMDGFAVAASETAQASQEVPVRLRVVGSVAAGCADPGSIGKGEAVRIFTGAAIPADADAVVPEEFCEERGEEVVIKAGLRAGDNVRPQGEDIRRGEVVLRKSELITPAKAGMLAAAGVSQVNVVESPGVVVIAVGDELAEPGQPLGAGKVYVSNPITLDAWLTRFRLLGGLGGTVADSETEITEKLNWALDLADAVITTGGARGSERDLVTGVLDRLGWKKLFHGVRMKPGKGTAFGLLQEKLIFCLPGGPTACEIAFLQLALPGIFHMAGMATDPFPHVEAKLTQEIQPRHPGWRRFIYGTHQRDAKGGYSVEPLLGKSRLKSMAQATCIIILPENNPGAAIGKKMTIQILT